MKSKKSITQKRVLENSLHQGQDRNIIKYGLDQEELQLAETVASQMDLSFPLVEAILAAYHTASIKVVDSLRDKEVQNSLMSLLEKYEEKETATGLFQVIAKPA